MHRKGSACYSIRLDGLLVIDCDDDSEELVNSLEARFGASPVHVRTPRGRHLYCDSDGFRPNLRGEGLPVDVKTGASAYVMAPGSIRPDCGEYFMCKGDLCLDRLPQIKHLDRPRQKALASSRIPVGARNDALMKMAIGLAWVVVGQDELLTALLEARDARCENRGTVPDAEVEKIASWAWRKRCENRLYTNRDSEFPVDRQMLDRLKG